MSNIRRMGLGLCASLLVALSAQAGVTLNAARVGAADVAGLEKFYEAAFGMQEVQKIGNNEVMLNFGDSVAGAKANPAAQIVIMHRDSAALIRFRSAPVAPDQSRRRAAARRRCRKNGR
jgi:hypothetical protein